MKQEYTHLPLGQEVTGLSGYYIPCKEVRLKHNGKEVLYVIGTSTVESSCCGGGTCGYAIVPGYILSWQIKKNDAGLPVSSVEPVEDETGKREIGKAIRDTENVRNIDFW
ncbi:MAG: hypothetical protein A2Y59_04975 [Chloroflexi bacterium RBG_13_52_14]|nr:MAG: hypothetical protein A2Y59_04975 [Chloroflexi bacterium RBG_13_52_14]